MTLRQTALAWWQGGRAAVVVEVCDSRGSVPRDDGTRMLVATDAVAGTIGGGHLELQAIGQARQLLRQGTCEVRQQAVALGPALGQCCGGALVLRYAALDAAALAGWPQPEPRRMLQIYGAGHVGRAVVAQPALAQFRVQWIDEREEEFPPGPLPPHVERVCVEPVEAEVRLAEPGAAFLVLTHSHDLDLRLSQAILARGDFAWFGLIGSKTKRARFEHRLSERGFGAALLERIVCPVGVPEVWGKEPEVIAVAVLAQLLSLPPR